MAPESADKMNTHNITISVVTASFNAENHLPRLIESLRNQTVRDFEWVVVDGASTDKTIELIRAADDVVSKWVSEHDFGIYDALNKGIKMASGDYYLVVGADDELHENAIENFIKAISEHKTDVVAANVLIGERVHRVRKAPSWLVGQFAYVAAHAVGTVFRRDLHDRFGYYSRKYPIAADALFIKRACQGGATLSHADFVAGKFGETGVSSTDAAGALSEFFRVQLETESKFRQLVIYILRLVKNYSRL